MMKESKVTQDEAQTGADVGSSVLLADALRGLIKLLDDCDLVRNTDGDGDAMVFMRQGLRITNALRAAQEGLQRRATCQWIDDENGPHETECGHAFEFMNDGVKENGFKYCCFCGGTIMLKSANEKLSHTAPTTT